MHAVQRQREAAGGVLECGGAVSELHEGVWVRDCVSRGATEGGDGEDDGVEWGREGAVYDMQEE